MVGVPPEKGAFVQIPTVVFGIAIEDPETARLTKRVLFISSFMAVLVCQDERERGQISYLRAESKKMISGWT